MRSKARPAATIDVAEARKAAERQAAILESQTAAQTETRNGLVGRGSTQAAKLDENRGVNNVELYIVKLLPPGGALIE